MLCERCLAMAFTFRKPSTACQITDFNLSGYRGALRSTSNQCPPYPRKRTSQSTVVMSALCQKQTFCDAAETVIRSPRRHGKQGRWNGQFERLGGRQIDQQL